MKKVGVVGVLLTLLVFSLLPLIVSAQSNSTNSSSSSIDARALSCINSKVVDSSDCSSLSVEEESFVFLTTGKCAEDLRSKGSDGECWPQGNCGIKQTALVSLALNSEKGEAWLKSKELAPSDLNWYVQVDSQEETSCTVGYDSRTYNFVINEDKTLSANAGTCLRRSNNGYWFGVDNNCLNNTYEFSCDASFTSNLIYSKRGDTKFFVSSETQAGSEGSSVSQGINSICSGERGKCDYEGTLWTVLLLQERGEDVEAYLPYLIAFAEENQRFGSYAFLYLITGFSEYYSSLQNFQKSAGYFDFASPYKRYYDTAAALLSISSLNSNELANVKDWLTQVQDSEGCWNSLRDTGFLLYSGWPTKSFTQPGSGTSTVKSCGSQNYFCMSSNDCSTVGGSALDYSCAGVSVCCSQAKPLQSCEAQGGSICQSGTTCEGGATLPSSDLGSCCVGGSCVVPQVPQASECEDFGYACRSSCFSDEETKSYSCNEGFEVCCGTTISSKSGGGSTVWIYVLIILVVLVGLLIIFRKKIFKGKFGGSSGVKSSPVSPSRPGGLIPFRRPQAPQPRSRPVNNYSARPQQQGTAPRRSNPGRDKELDETFRKLKEMSK